MKTMFAWKQKWLYLIFVMIAISACTPIPNKKTEISRSSAIPVVKTRLPPQNPMPPGTDTPFVSLPATPSPSLTKDLPPATDFAPFPTSQPTNEPTIVWGDQASQYATLVISADQQMIVYRLRDQSLSTFIIQKEKEASLLGVQRMIDACHLLASVKTQQDGLRFSLEIYHPRGVLTQEMFYLENEDPDTMVKFQPVWSPSKRYISYVIYSGALFYDTAQHQDVELVEVNQPEKPIRLTERGGAWKEVGAWSPKGDQIAYTDYDGQGNLQVYLGDLTSNTRRAITHFTNVHKKPGPIHWSPSGEEIIAFLGETQDSFNEAWVIHVPTGTVYAIPKPADGTRFEFGGTLWWSSTGDKILLTGGGEPGSGGLYWLDAKTFDQIHTLKMSKAVSLNENADTINQPFLLAADLSVIGFYNSSREFFAYRVIDQKIEPLQGLEGNKWGTIWDIKAFPEDVLACAMK